MATANFYSYGEFPNLYFITLEEVEDRASCDGIEYDDEAAMSAYIEKYFKDMVILDDYDIGMLRERLEAANDEIHDKAIRLCYESPRYRDQCEGEDLRGVSLKLEDGYYEGAQIAIDGPYRYLNKTNKGMIRRLMEKIARAFYMKDYSVAYRFSNGETGYKAGKQYKPTARELAGM